MIQSDITVSQGSTFLISDLRGDIGEEDYQGLFYIDVRHLSVFTLLLNNTPIEPLTSAEFNSNNATFIASNKAFQKIAKNSISIIRKRIIEEGFHEDIVLINHSTIPAPVTLQLHFEVDFADIHEVKSCFHKDKCNLPEKRLIKKSFDKKENQLTIKYTHNDFARATKIRFTRPYYTEHNTAVFTKILQPKEEWKLCVLISFVANGKEVSSPATCPTSIHSKVDKPKEKVVNTLDEWKWSTPKLETNWDDLYHSYTKSIFDLAALRMHRKETTGKHIDLPAAGLPWFMAVFGRDSLITAYQTLLFGDMLAQGTLRTLADYQGTKVDLQSEEQPGRILHEMRFGEVAHFGSWVKFPYYGTVDATPLFLILLSELYRWGGERKFIKEMKDHALSALAWIDNSDLDKDGFVEYQKMSKRGLDNQNWRDSWDSMVFNNGRYAASPIASADIQGYVFDAKLRIAQIARDVWNDEKLAQRLEEQAKTLKEKFNQAFWIREKGYFALGLDKDKKQIDSLSSGVGHLLWSGIVDEDKILPIAENLISADLYSGWGVRTIGKESRGFNPLIYHRGTVWPHDNSLIAAGLMRAGYKDHALRIIKDMLTASSFFDYRLPEVFAGFDRDIAPFPVQYPTASSPQAWAAAVPILFLRLLLGIEPDIQGKTLRINPSLPPHVEFIRLDGVTAFGKRFLIEASAKESKITQVEEWMCHICNIKVRLDHKHTRKM